MNEDSYTDIVLNFDLGPLLIEVNNQEDLTSAEKALESAYNNYYVNEEHLQKQ
ncbi:hypothetical protein [Mycoplasma sp. BRA290]|uniref:hypothetical protein n=1 Tax=Mycoplasma sp. BRA290 TaxID=3401675 RepID=UPI003AAE183A